MLLDFLGMLVLQDYPDCREKEEDLDSQLPDPEDKKVYQVLKETEVDQDRKATREITDFQEPLAPKDCPETLVYQDQADLEVPRGSQVGKENEETQFL